MMLTPLQAQYFEFLMWKAYELQGRTWDKKLLISLDGQLFSGNFLIYDEQHKPHLLIFEDNVRKIPLYQPNAESSVMHNVSLNLNKTKLDLLKLQENCDVMTFLYVLQSFNPDNCNPVAPDSEVMLFDVNAINADKEIPFICVAEELSILSVID